jgi:hypothetical protein
VVERERLHTEEDDVVRIVYLSGVDDVWLDGEIAIGTDNAQAVALELLQSRLANEKGDVAASFRELCTEESADSAGTDDENFHGYLPTNECCSGQESGGRRRVAGGWSRFGRSWRIDPGTHQEKEIDEKDGDEDEASNEDVRPKTHHRFVLREIRGRDVIGLVLAVVFVHAHQLTLQSDGAAVHRQIFSEVWI